MFKIKFLLFTQICILILLSTTSARNCLDDTNEFYCKLGSKTPYRFIANHNDSRLNYPGKNLNKVYILFIYNKFDDFLK